MNIEHQNASTPQPDIAPAHAHSHIRVFAIGGAGAAIAEELMRNGFAPAAFAVLNTCAKALAKSSAAAKIHLPHGKKRGTHTAHQSDELLSQIKGLCEAADTAFVMAGLGGRTGTDLAALVAKTAKEAGLTTLAFVTLPFECEGSLRQEKARAGLDALKAVADGVVCLPGQKILKLIDENTSLAGTFEVSNALLGGAVRGVSRMLASGGLIDVHQSDLCAILGGGRDADSVFATAEAAGPNRSREAVEKLFAHPLLDGGQVLADAEAVLVNLIGGHDLAMADVNRIMEEIMQRCDGSHIIMGAAVDESAGDRLVVTLLASRRHNGTAPALTTTGTATEQSAPSTPRDDSDLRNRLLSTTTTARPHSRTVVPAPEMTQEGLQELLSKQRGRAGSRRNSAAKMRQAQLPLEIVSKGRFDKSEPTIHKGEDLDLPTYVRRGVVLN